MLKFCIESNPSVYHDSSASAAAASAVGSNSGGGSGNTAGSGDGGAAEGVSEPAECFIQAAFIKADNNNINNNNNENVNSNTPALFTPKQRLQLCANAHTAYGPINCTTTALNRGQRAGTGAGNAAATNTGEK